MSKIKFKIQGIDQAKRMLSSLPQEFNDNTKRDAHRQAALKIVKPELAKSAPVGNNDKKASAKTENNVMVTNAKKSKTGIWIGFAKRVFYVLFQERGTTKRQKKSGQNTGSIPAKPFISQAHDRAAPNAIKFLTDNYLKLINRALKKFVRRIKK